MLFSLWYNWTYTERQATQQVTEAGVNVMEGDKSKESDGEFGDLCHVSDSKNRKPISLKIHR